MFNIKKIIPGKIVIKTWYWLEVQKQMVKDLESIFFTLEIEDYTSTEVLMEKFRKDYDPLLQGMPYWLATEVHAQISRAEAMFACLSTPFTEE